MNNKEFIEAVLTAALAHEEEADAICIGTSRYLALDFDNKIIIRQPKSEKREVTLCGLNVCVSGDLKDDQFFIGKILPLKPKKEDKNQSLINALMDLRDEFVAKQPRSEWVTNKVAQGVEKGIEMCIEKVREMAQHD